MTSDQKRQLEKQLWAIANDLRGKINADEYKNYILGFIFYKYLSEKQINFANKRLASSQLTYDQILDKDPKYIEMMQKYSVEDLGFFLRPDEIFSYLVARAKGEKGNNRFILEDLKRILNTIEQTSRATESEEDFTGLFSDVDLTSTKLGKTENAKNEIISEILIKLNEIDFDLDQSQSDMLGDAYEYLIGEFAAGAGKKAGEFYTPSQVSKLLAKLVTVGKKQVRSAYDPTCGSGSLLLKLRNHVEVSDYYGQDNTHTAFNLARMNMMLHDVPFARFDIKHGDTLTDDQFPKEKFEIIVANPPFSLTWKGEKDPVLAQDDRFTQYGRLAPKSAADYAFITHMLYHLADNGQMAVVVPHGVLFRSGAEGTIRKYIIEKQNVLDAVIGLPANLFFGTSIPACILVFHKCRKHDQDVFFIDASKEFEKGKNQNYLKDEHIQKIFETYVKREDVDKYAHKAPLSEIQENDYNLNIPRYVDTFEEEEPIDIQDVANQLKSLQKEEGALQAKIKSFCDELKIDTPF
ncbi:MAG: type I restriction-modification system subunit M [Bdellovibrionales bacterium]|nr:type I restriction-modification system subunit M [Bdellovibrionales bacterium]